MSNFSSYGNTVFIIHEKKLTPVMEFPNSEEAQNYVRDQHRFNPIFVKLAHTMMSDERDRFLDLFSFYDDRYLLNRTYFTGDEETLEMKLISAGILFSERKLKNAL